MSCHEEEEEEEEEDNYGSDDSVSVDNDSEENEILDVKTIPSKKATRSCSNISYVNDYAADIREVITKYSENPLELSTFSIGGEIEDTMGIPAVHVEGVGRIAYPLCREQTVTLLGVSSQAPFGKGKETVTDVDVRRARQIDSGLVKINQKWLDTALPKLVTQCCAKLGIDAAKMNVRANLYKMLLYEEGGHFKKHRDTEKEPGMFGSLLIQLPAEHEGGHLVVEHEKQSKRYPFDVESGDKGYYAAFYADCEHTLEPVTKGLRLVLAFNLVRGALSRVPATSIAPVSAAHRRGFDEVLAAAGKAWLDDDNAYEKLVVPLAHQYTDTNMSFAGLKGTDLSTLTLLQNVVDPETKQKMFSVYLGLVTKHMTGPSAQEDYGYHRPGGGMDPDYGDVNTSYETEGWVGPNGKVDLGSLSIELEEEIIAARGLSIENIFGLDPDDEEDEGYCGNYAGTLEYWYHSAVLVFWPAQRDFDIQLSANLAQVITSLEGMDRSSAEFSHKLTRLLAFLATRTSQSWCPAEVLVLVQTLEQVKAVFAKCHFVTLDERDMVAIVEEVRKHGWNSLGSGFTALLAQLSPTAITKLLRKLEPLCSQLHQQSNPGITVVPLEAWREMVKVLVSKILQSNGKAPSNYKSGYLYSPHCALPSAVSQKLNEEWTSVSLFVIAHTEVADQEKVAAHAASLMELHILNHFIEQLRAVGGPSEELFIEKLLSCAVQKCLDKKEFPEHVTPVLGWVLRGEHSKLLIAFRPALERLCNDAAQFRALFAMPVVLEALKKDSALSRELESYVQVRISALELQVTAPPAFSWRMPANHIVTNDPRVGPFLASDEVRISLSGTFTSIVQARKWATQYFDSVGLRGVSAEAFGSAKNAYVTLVKNKVMHEAAVKRYTENTAELQRLRKLLRARGRDVATSGGVREAENVAPTQKKAKVEPHIYVID